MCSRHFKHSLKCSSKFAAHFECHAHILVICHGSTDYSHKIKTLAPWKESYDKPRQCIKRQRHHFVNKGLYSRSYGFSSSCVLMWELDLKEGWAPKNWCFWTVVLEKTLESPLDCKIKPVNLKGNQCWLFTERTNAETEVPILRASFLEKTLMLGRIEGKRRRGSRGWDV